MVLVYEWKLQRLPSSIDNAHVLYKQKAKKKLRNVFIYKNPDTFQKARQFPLGFCIKKRYTLRYGIFMKFWSWHFYAKSMTLYVTWSFIYKKLDNSQKAIQFEIRFYIQKSGHFALLDFYWIFEIGGGGGISLFKNPRHFAKSNTICNMF